MTAQLTVYTLSINNEILARGKSDEQIEINGQRLNCCKVLNKDDGQLDEITKMHVQHIW